MIMPDVSVLVYAHRVESERHSYFANYIKNLAEKNEPFALSELVVSGFLKIVTNSRIFKPASELNQALLFIKELKELPHSIFIRPESSHFEIFENLCLKYHVKGKMIADAYQAALAIEHGMEWVTADNDFSRFRDDLRFKLL